MNQNKIKVTVTRQLPKPVETRMKELFDVNLSNSPYSLSREQLHEKMQNCDVLVPTIGDKIDGDLIIEETNFGRTLYFNKDGSLRWSHVNRAENGTIYLVAWSRILHTQKDIETVNNFLDNKGTCNE